MTVERAQFGTLLKHYRVAAALSQEALADQAGLSLDAISALESGRRGGPRLETARRLCDALCLAGEDRALFLAAARSSGPVRQDHGVPEPHADRVRALDNLPVPGTSFIGREQEMTEVMRLLRATRLLTMTGTGGMGKTRLAVHVAATVAGTFADGVVFVPLATLTDSSLVAATIATALGLGERGRATLAPALLSPMSMESVVSPEELLLAFLREKHLLLVLDNFEQVATAAPLLSRLLAAAPRLAVVATSRVALHLYAE